ncbi:hypothetical protein DYB36_009093 [Aphanomyces astaci]|uniref:RING-type domain-containing protein n=1 Tax=Aphanomyces astaci TaxID=112090 RepID=A0A397A136_APHAT|nr:hypothetical protein DYB36_009093 [Aphanomyces astaci]
MEEPTRMLGEPVSEPENNATLAVSLPGKAVCEDAVEDVQLVTCQVCFDTVLSQDAMTRICRETCHGIVCGACMSSYLNVCTESAPHGVLSRLKCPICVRPLNMHRLITRASTSNDATSICDHATLFRERVEASCEMLCPECHRTTNILYTPPSPDGAIDNKIDSNDWPKSVLACRRPDHVPDIVAACIRYCNHDLTADAILAYLARALGDEDIEFVQNLLGHMFDPERRVGLFLATMKRDSFKHTPCCDAEVCFVCKREGHHPGQPCATYLPEIEDMAQCSQCDLMLVKGDGCSSITCFCGHEFDWDVEVAQYRLKVCTVQALSPRHRPAFVAIATYLRHQAFRRKYAVLVIAQLPMFVLHKRLADLAPVLFYPPWSTSFRTGLQACMARRRVIRQTIAHRASFQQLVIHHVGVRVQHIRLARLTSAVAQPHSIWRTLFKALVVRSVTRRRFRKVLLDIPMVVEQRQMKQERAIFMQTLAAAARLRRHSRLHQAPWMAKVKAALSSWATTQQHCALHKRQYGAAIMAQVPQAVAGRQLRRIDLVMLAQKNSPSPWWGQTMATAVRRAIAKRREAQGAEKMLDGVGVAQGVWQQCVGPSSNQTMSAA